MEILLVRHGQTPGNVDRTVYLETPDHEIGLTEQGWEEADHAGEALAWWMASRDWERRRTRLWHSPYKRARHTTDALWTHIEHLVRDRREHVLLAEQQHGLFDGLDLDGGEAAERFPEAWRHYQRTCDFEGRFWAAMPMGESRFDVAQRVHQSFGTFHRDAERHGIDHLIVVCHGTTMRAFEMMWLHHPWEWFETARNPANCEVRWLSGDRCEGVVHPGGLPVPS